MKTLQILFMALAVCAAMAVTTPAFAQRRAFDANLARHGMFGRFGHFGGGFGNGIISYPSMHEFARTIPRANGGNSILPYYSLYPPVYYSHSVPRPYGFSPFALPPGMQPAEPFLSDVAVDYSKEIINPFFKPEEKGKGEELPQEEAATTLDNTAKLILNPYFRQQELPTAPRFVMNPYVAGSASGAAIVTK